MKLLRRKADPEQFDRAVDALLPHAFAPLSLSMSGRRYYEATLCAAHNEISFAVMEGKSAVAALVGDVADHVLGRFGQPAGWMLDKTVLPCVQRDATHEAIGELGLLMRQEEIAAASIQAPSPIAAMDPLASSLLSLGFLPSPSFLGSVGLEQTAEAIERNLRKGHRQQIKWGRKNLDLQILERGQGQPQMLDTYRQLHAEVSGRATRGDESWEATENMIHLGNARLILSFMEDVLMGGTLIMNAGDTAYYASGAYRREHFDKPLAHWPMLAAILAAKQDGLARFDVGDVTPRAIHSEKDRNIIRFKRGFTSDVTSGMLWQWHLDKTRIDAE